MSLRFPASARVRHKADFKLVQDNNQKIYAKHFLVLAHRRTAASKSQVVRARIGLTVTTKLDKRAVRRNYLKRKLREIFRLYQERIDPNFDIVVIARNGSMELDIHQIEDEIVGALRYHRILK